MHKAIFRLLTISLLQIVSVLAFANEQSEKLAYADDIRSQDPQKFQELLAEVARSSETLTEYDRDYLAYLQAYELTFKGKFVEGLSNFKKLSQSSSFDDIKIRSLLTLVNAYAIQRLWSDGLQALSVIQSIDSSELGERINIQILATSGIFYNQLGQYKLGFEYAHKLKRRSNLARNLCFAEQLQFETVVRTMSDTLVVKEAFESASDSCRAADERVVLSDVIRLYALHLLENLNQAQAAHELLKQHESLVLSAGYAPVTVIYQSLQAKAYWQLGMSEPAFELAQAVSQSPAAANTLEALIRANKVLFDYHSANGNSEAALAAYIKYAEADKAYLDEVKTKTLAFQLAQHQTLVQQNKISLLDEQNKLLTVQRQLDRAEQYNSRIMIAVMFCVILGMGTWGWNSFRSQRRLKQLAEYDSLTGLFSRGHFTNVAESALNHAFKLNAPASCVLFDVDRFKGINDKYGHSTGDWALKQVAALCRNQLREFEVFGRIGGEEFCLILPKCDREHALQIAEKLRSTLANCKTSACGYDFALTASFGVTDSSLAGYSMDSLLAQADRAMYKAKHTGRNRVCTYCPIEDGEVESASQQSPLTAS